MKICCYREADLRLLFSHMQKAGFLTTRLNFIVVCPLHYTPGIYAEGYIVFVFPFVRSYVRMFVRSFVRSFVRTSFRHVEFASKFCVKVSQVVYISATTHQKAFIFGP